MKKGSQAKTYSTDKIGRSPMKSRYSDSNPSIPMAGRNPHTASSVGDKSMGRSPSSPYRK